MNKVEVDVYEKLPTPKSQVLKTVDGRSHESLRFWTFFYVKAEAIELSGEGSWYRRALSLRFPCLSHLHAGLMGQSQFEPSHPLVVIPRDPSEIMFLVPVLNHCWALHLVCFLYWSFFRWGWTEAQGSGAGSRTKICNFLQDQRWTQTKNKDGTFTTGGFRQ